MHRLLQVKKTACLPAGIVLSFAATCLSIRRGATCSAYITDQPVALEVALVSHWKQHCGTFLKEGATAAENAIVVFMVTLRRCCCWLASEAGDARVQPVRAALRQSSARVGGDRCPRLFGALSSWRGRERPRRFSSERER